MAARILLSFGADSEMVRNEVIRALGTGSLLRGNVVAIEPRQGLDAGWLGGLGPLLDRLAADIRHELGREPDLGDLLLALACAHDTVAARALSGLGVEPNALSGTIERVRHHNPGPREELMRKIHAACRAKEQAIAAQEFENAAGHRDQERKLRELARTQTPVPPEVLQEIHLRLGIPTSRDDTPKTPPDSE
ncbi:MAG: UvrB/UvrC motif-containing protein [Actinomycetota bacterium]|nr:UvrB/UvrC motif-containing protein [Actinomycetota bacterium]